MKLYPYQVEDVEWLKEHQRCILGSSMGVGKTAEALALVTQLDLRNVLVVCPLSLVAEWHYQADLWGVEQTRLDIINYEKLRKMELVELIMKAGYEMIVFDEVHKLKNPKALQTKGAFLISPFSPRVLLMSGTPIQNGPQDLYALLRIIDPATFKSYWQFVEQFCYLEQLPIPPYPRLIKGAKNKEELRELLGDYMLRREKDEVLDLPPKLYRTIPVELEERQLEKYKNMEDELFALLDGGEKVTAPTVLAQLLRLRQICLEPNLLSPTPTNRTSTPSAKTRLLLDLIDGISSPLVIYTYFEKYVRILSEELKKRKIEHAVYTGEVSVYNRAKAVREFGEDGHKVLIGTITSMGLGLTLTASHTVVFMDKWYNPAVNEQATDRLHRIGQTEKVEVVDMWAVDTVEDHMHRVIERKERVFGDIIGETVESMRRSRNGKGKLAVSEVS